MKLILPIVLAVICIGLVIALVVTKHDDHAQHETDTATITDFSNRLDTAELDRATYHGSMLIFSNNFNEARSSALAFSNQLTEAQASIAAGAEQITNLNRQVAEMKLENQTASGRVVDLTNQVAGLTKRLALTEASLAQTNQDLATAHKDYALLENRFRIDVAERVVAERRFNNPSELKAQLEKLKKNPTGTISADSIYAGLNVEVKSNGAFHVISTN